MSDGKTVRNSLYTATCTHVLVQKMLFVLSGWQPHSNCRLIGNYFLSLTIRCGLLRYSYIESCNEFVVGHMFLFVKEKSSSKLKSHGGFTDVFAISSILPTFCPSHPNFFLTIDTILDVEFSIDKTCFLFKAFCVYIG